MDRVRRVLLDAVSGAQGWSRRSLSLAAGLGPDGVRNILSGRSGNPKMETLIGLAAAMGRDVSIFFKDRSDDVVVDKAMQFLEMKVAFPSADALTQMFDAMLLPFESSDARRDELAQALARRLPVALAQLQGPLYALEADEDLPRPRASRAPSEDHRGLPPQPSR